MIIPLSESINARALNDLNIVFVNFLFLLLALGYWLEQLWIFSYFLRSFRRCWRFWGSTWRSLSLWLQVRSVKAIIIRWPPSRYFNTFCCIVILLWIGLLCCFILILSLLLKPFFFAVLFMGLAYKNHAREHQDGENQKGPLEIFCHEQESQYAMETTLSNLILAVKAKLAHVPITAKAVEQIDVPEDALEPEI